MNKFFSTNLMWKLFSLAVAALLWLIVINTQNPILPKQINNFPITIKGISQIEEKGYVILNQEELEKMTIDIDIIGGRLEVDELVKNKNDLINSTLDLTPFATFLTDQSEKVERAVVINTIVLIDEVTVEGTSPKIVNVIFEKEASKTLPIEYEIIGEDKDKGSPIIKTLMSQVTVTGAKSIIENLDKAVIEINLSEFNKDNMRQTLPINIIDVGGNIAENVRSSIKDVDVIIPIGKEKFVPIEPQFTGALPNEYIKTNTILSPRQVKVVGDEEVIDELQSLKLEPISLDNKIYSITQEAEILLPEGVEIVDRVDDSVIVTLEIQKEKTHEFVIDTSNINFDVIGLKEGLTFDIIENQITLTLSGTTEMLLEFNESKVNAQIDFSGLNEGEYSIPIEIELKNYLRVTNPPVMIDVRLKPISLEEKIKK
ncbi:MAG: hypothetical protein ATN32_10355 [Candidatus Epulonipiscium fishelsonii]|nr:MAG: hypothetical protein ATN32_10355 [Epulopiscium sp. AS2M-Bin002]